MNEKIAGTILLSVAGLVVAIGGVGSQIAFAIVQGQFFAGGHGGINPPGPESATMPWATLAAAIVLAVAGLFCLFRPTSTTRKG
jgi:hypothetical protein